MTYPRMWLLQRRSEIMTKPETSGRSGKESQDERTTSSDVPTIDSGRLLRGGRVVQIMHGDETYRLLVTRNDKLILQK